jgi:pectin methylesterase-like acyl-CoA thioesterase
MMRRLLCVLLLCGSAFAAPPKKTVTVALDGSGDFKDVQSAVDSAPEGKLIIRIKPGIYKQRVHITAPGIELRGLGSRPHDVVLTFGNSHAMAGGTTASASTTISGDDFYAENLTFENSFSRDQPDAHGDTQAVALLSLGDRQVYRHIRLIGAQDTLYANSKTCHSTAEITAAQPCAAARQYFSDCYIEGHIDFIFGDAKAVFDHCDIHAISHPLITLTAQSRVYPAEDSGYLFLDCTVTADPAAENIMLGRPWRAYSTVYFVNTDFKAALNPAGWAEWDGKLKTSTYAEFGSHGEGGDPKLRIAGTHILSAAEAEKLTIYAWLGGVDGWVPTKVR